MWQLLGLLFLMALVFKFWPWILGAAVLWLLIKFGLPVGQRAIREMREETQAEHERVARRNAELAARADLQHAWVLEGDPRGIYGRYPPTRFS